MSSKKILDSADKHIETTVHFRKGANPYYVVTVILGFFQVGFTFVFFLKDSLIVLLTIEDSPPKRGSQEAEKSKKVES